MQKRGAKVPLLFKLKPVMTVDQFNDLKTRVDVLGRYL